MYNLKRNNIFKNLYKNCYIAKRLEPKLDDYGNEIEQYSKPKKYRFNVQPIGGTTNSTSGRTDIMAYGQKAMQMQRAIIDYKTYFGIFEVDDLAYLDGKTPKGEIVNGGKANYRIDAVLNQNKVIAITGFKNEDIQDHQYLMFLKYAKKYNCKVHCLGMTRKKVLDKVPFDYVDSSSWLQQVVYGRSLNGRKLPKIKSKEDRTLQMSYNYKLAMDMQEKYYKKWKHICKD